ncbi:MAG TPA: hypothetical protein H9898_05105 [Candidatus Anaerobiospirillum stercoravium]|nr:hypothetical protein [Candidatus Anaerobiospirillum stercoravium]
MSVDNLFVMMAIFAWFKVPEQFCHRVLYWGVLGAILVLSAQERRIVAWRAYPHNQPCQEGIVPSVHMHNKYLAPAAN